MDAAETAKLQIDVGLELGRPRRSSAFGKLVSGLGDQRRGWEARTGQMSLP